MIAIVYIMNKGGETIKFFNYFIRNMSIKNNIFSIISNKSRMQFIIKYIYWATKMSNSVIIHLFILFC